VATAATPNALPPHDEPLLCELPAPDPRPADAVLLVRDEAAFLAPLPLATAEPPPALLPVFTSWGLHTLGDFRALPRDEIVRRFGAAGLAFWHRAGGGEPRPLHPVAPPREFAAARTLEEPVETLEKQLEAVLDHLAATGIDNKLILEPAMITPSCGTGSLDVEDAEKVFELLGKLSKRMREKYGFDQ